MDQALTGHGRPCVRASIGLEWRRAATRVACVHAHARQRVGGRSNPARVSPRPAAGSQTRGNRAGEYLHAVLITMIRNLIVSIAIVPCIILLLPAVVMVALVFTFVAAVRAIARRFEPAFRSWTDLIEFDRKLGWRPRAGLDTHYLAIDDDVFRIVTDREGWPGTNALDKAKVVVIGDSFAFGYGIDTNRSFAALTPDVPVKAVGAPGYSMVQGALLMEQLGERLRGKLLVWFTFLENDLQDNLAPEMRGYRSPFVRPDRAGGSWEIVDQHVTPKKWDCSRLDPHRLFPTFC